MDTDAQRSERLYAYPIQIVRTEDGAVVRRGIVRLHVRGENAADILIEIAQAASRPNGSARSEIAARFDADLRPAIGDLIDALLARRLLVTLEQGAERRFPRAGDDRGARGRLLLELRDRPR